MRQAAAGRLGWLGALVVMALLCSTAQGVNRPELSAFEMLHIVTGDTGAQPAARSQPTEAQWNNIDAKLMDKETAHPQMLSTGGNWIEEDSGDGFEPYTEDLDSQITNSGVPDSLMDGDTVLTNRYEDWIRNYKREPNVPEVPWSYDGPDSMPDLWATLNKNYQLCDPDLTGKMSSPINIDTTMALPACYGPSFPTKDGPVYEGDKGGLTESFDRSFTVDVQGCTQECKICNAKCDGGPVISGSAIGDHGEKPVVLDRIVFHTPSEHKIDGEAYGLELQFYHCTQGEAQDHIPCTPSLAMAVLFKDGGASASNPMFLTKFFNTLTEVGNKPVELAKGLTTAQISKELAPLFKKYYRYTGSQTYPPCYQGVDWMVATGTLEVSTSLIQAFANLQGENVRPEFALGYRTLQLMSQENRLHWTYGGPRGQKNWAKIIEYASCGTGAEDCEILPSQAARDSCIAETTMQSPIDIFTREYMENVDYGGRPAVNPVGLRPIAFDVGASSSTNLQMYIRDGSCQPLSNKFNAYVFAIKVPGNVRMTYWNTIYTLEEIEFHTPSEHSFDGLKSDLEVQFKMAQTGCVPCGNQCCAPNNNENTRLHLSILFKRGAASPEFIERIANTVSAASGTPEALIPDLKFMDISVNIHPLLSTYFFYDGSLTTPPCSTKVTWLVLKTVLAVKDEHLHMFQKVTPGDSEYNVRAQKSFARTRKTVSGCTNSKWPCDGISVAGTIQL